MFLLHLYVVKLLLNVQQNMLCDLEIEHAFRLLKFTLTTFLF